VTRLAATSAATRCSPTASTIVVAVEVWAERQVDRRLGQARRRAPRSKVKARTYDQLMFRHWDHWEDGKFSHLFVWTAPEAGGRADDARDLTPGQATDSPTGPFGEMDEVSISPDGKTVAFVARVAGREDAWRPTPMRSWSPSTATVGPSTSPRTTRVRLAPTFSPDGKSIAVRMMKRAGFEADRQRIAIIDAASHKLRVVTEAWDRSAGAIVWSATAGRS